MPLSLLVTGGDGQLGRALSDRASQAAIEVHALTRSELDITDPISISKSLARHQPEVVVNCAAYTAVDRAEDDEASAFAINAAGAENLAVACREHDVPLIHISTDYVFDGSKTVPYQPSDPTNPASAYGRSKLAGEHAVARACPQHVIFRTAWVYSAQGANFVKTMLRLAMGRDIIRVVGDQIGSPTYAPHLAGAILTVAETTFREQEHFTHWGTYHAAGGGHASWADMARLVFAEAARHGLASANVETITTAQFPTAAKRPANSRLDCTRLVDVFGVTLPDWQTGIAECVSAIAATTERG